MNSDLDYKNKPQEPSSLETLISDTVRTAKKSGYKRIEIKSSTSQICLAELIFMRAMNRWRDNG
jgi:hypothetical protein